MKSARRDFDFTPPALREVSLRVAAVNGINLGQGVCQTPTPTLLCEAAAAAMQSGFNRYAPAQGILELREAIADKLRRFNRLDLGADDVLITNGATGAFESVVQTMLEPGDEVILFRPYYPYHRNAVLRAGGTLKYCYLHGPNWNFDFAELESCVSARTKLLVISSPNNPTGKVFSKQELVALGEFCKSHGIWCVTDEVYEYICYDGQEHFSPASEGSLRDCIITIGSYSKTFSITGWRIGYMAAPKPLAPKLRAVSDQIYVCAPTPLQHAVATAIRELPQSYYIQLHTDYTRKRSLMEEALKAADFSFSRPQGAYYFLASPGGRFKGMPAEALLDMMIAKAGIGAVPTCDFMGPEVKGDAQRDCYLRFCFSVPDELLAETKVRLAGLLA